MSMMTASPQVPTTPPEVFPCLYRFTVAQYDRMVQDGTIGKNERVELIEGLLVTKMGKNPPHVFAGKLGLKRLERLVSPGWHVGKEDPVVVSEWSKPEPDLSVVRGTRERLPRPGCHGRRRRARGRDCRIESLDRSVGDDQGLRQSRHPGLLDRQPGRPPDRGLHAAKQRRIPMPPRLCIGPECAGRDRGREVGRIPVSDIVP